MPAKEEISRSFEERHVDYEQAEALRVKKMIKIVAS